VRTFSKSPLTSRLHQDLDLKNTNTSGRLLSKNQSRLSWKCNSRQRVDEKYQRQNFVLLIGLSYKPQNQIELYGNVSQNYRSVTFNDIRTVSPSSVIDPTISDEKGYTSDIGSGTTW
jgi:outer membrane receptor protein involved in Fe transport